MTKRHRSAVTGEYVTAEQAKADPERTVSESADVGREFMSAFWQAARRDPKLAAKMVGDAQDAALLARIEALEAVVAELRAAKGNNDNN